jgi:pyruvate dehydrogenase E1 component beta subunit
MESEQMYGDKGEVPDEYNPNRCCWSTWRNRCHHLSFGKIIKEAHKAAGGISQRRNFCEIIDLRTVRPMDYDTILTSVKKQID